MSHDKSDRPRIGRAPGRAVVIYDGECEFCRWSVKVLVRLAGERLEYVQLQDETLRERFPELGEERLKEALHLVAATGDVSTGAEAVYRALATRRLWRGLLWAYERVPGWKLVSEWGYRVVARNRGLLYKVVRLFDREYEKRILPENQTRSE